MIVIDEEDYLEHFGVKGMKWGVRKSSTEGVSRSVDRQAKKDAQEFARAKSFYGTGAGTRRKLVKQTVEGKSKRLPGYDKAFQKHLSEQDPSKHASKAVTERKRTDRRVRNKQRVGALARSTTGEMGTQAALVAAAMAGAAYLKSPQGQRTMNTSVRKAKRLALANSDKVRTLLTRLLK